jgi:hypothetical protein
MGELSQAMYQLHDDKTSEVFTVVFSDCGLPHMYVEIVKFFKIYRKE